MAIPRWVSVGDRNQRLELQTRSTGPGGVVIWQTEATRAAHVEMLTGQEQLEAAQLLAGRPGRVTFGYDPVTVAIRPSDRLKLNARIFEVVSVVDVHEQHRQVEVTVLEQVE